MTVADTDVLIDYLEGIEPMAAQLAVELDRGSLCTTSVNRFELLSGARTARQEATIRALLAAVSSLPLDEEPAAPS